MERALPRLHVCMSPMCEIENLIRASCLQASLPDAAKNPGKAVGFAFIILSHKVSRPEEVGNPELDTI